MDILQELVDAYLDYNAEHPYFLDIREKQVVLDMDSSFSGEPGIDWDDVDSEDRYIEVPKYSSNEAYEVMESFVETLEEKDKSAKLARALNQRKPFRHFKDALADTGLAELWYQFENEYARAQIEEWLEEEGISL